MTFFPGFSTSRRRDFADEGFGKAIERFVLPSVG
jgi:hypothetical protein